MEPISVEKALQWAEDLCSRAEYASGEIFQKLIRKGLSHDDATKIVESLVGRRFIDDTRFARAFVRDKVNYARWGRMKIVMALRQKRVPDEAINEALEEIDWDQYLDSLIQILRGKLRSLKTDEITYETRARLYRYAASRGYDSDIISRALRTLE